MSPAEVKTRSHLLQLLRGEGMRHASKSHGGRTCHVSSCTADQHILRGHFGMYAVPRGGLLIPSCLPRP